MVDFRGPVDAAFRHVGRDATYTPVGGVGVSLRVVVGPKDMPGDFGFETRARVDRITIDVRRADVAAPKENDRLDLDGKSYSVQSLELDREQLVWRLDVRPF